MENSRVFVRAGVHDNFKLAAGILLSTTLLGLCTYIWAFWCQRNHVKKIRGPLGNLISVDITNVITGIIMASGLTQSIPIIWYYPTTVWLLTRSYGVILHLLSSAWCLLCLNQPQMEAKKNYILAVVFMSVCVLTPVYIFASHVAIYILGLITVGLALGVIASFRVSVRSPSAAREKKLIMSLAMCIFLIVFFPTFVLECLLMSNSNSNYDIQIIYVNVLFFTNIHLVFNGWLCFSILKLSTAAEENEQQLQQPPQHQWQQPPHHQWQQPPHHQWQQPPQHQWQQPPQHQWQQPPHHQWQQPPQHQWQQPPQQQPQQGWENPGFDVSVFTVDKGQNTN